MDLPNDDKGWKAITVSTKNVTLSLRAVTNQTGSLLLTVVFNESLRSTAYYVVQDTND